MVYISKIASLPIHLFPLVPNVLIGNDAYITVLLQKQVCNPKPELWSDGYFPE